MRAYFAVEQRDGESCVSRSRHGLSVQAAGRRGAHAQIHEIADQAEYPTDNALHQRAEHAVDSARRRTPRRVRRNPTRRRRRRPASAPAPARPGRSAPAGNAPPAAGSAPVPDSTKHWRCTRTRRRSRRGRSTTGPARAATLACLQRYIHMARQNSAAEPPTRGSRSSRPAKRSARHDGNRPSNSQTTTETATRPAAPRTTPLERSATGPSSWPVSQKTLPISATNHTSAHRAMARSMMTVATATVRRLCSRTARPP